jgi:predicted DNA-binding transcriptional regulator
VTVAATPRQLEIHTWMLAFQAEHSMPPTVRELAAAFGFTTTAAHDHLTLMAKKGLVQHRPMIARGWIAIAVTPTSEVA